ncbi:histidine phosphatase family protein [Candidatus Microgenomates bacterium]|nr:histidine phosphatase family protein [Candidatus Microgenomates bacterium]
MKIYLVRHAAYSNPENVFAFHLPVYLSIEGRDHVQRIGEWFKTNDLTSLPIMSSPIVRCVQTSEIIAGHIGSNVTLDERLVEVANPVLQGTSMSPEHWSIEDAHPDTETLEQVCNRMFNWLDDIIAADQDIVGVSHGTPLTVLYNTLIDQPLPRPLWSPEQTPKNIQRGEIAILTIKDRRLIDHERIII